jgi:hypothetical protein
MPSDFGANRPTNLQPRSVSNITTGARLARNRERHYFRPDVDLSGRLYQQRYPSGEH